MNNYEKKLDALIDALGFDVETIVDRKETPISKQSGVNKIASCAFGDLVCDGQGAWKRGQDECYYLKPSLNADYKLTKRDSPPFEQIGAYSFTKPMVENIIEILGDHTVGRNGHNNDDVFGLISKLEGMIEND